MNCEILKHEKKDCRNSPFLALSFAHSSFITFSYTNTETLYIITETLILSRKLPSCFRDNTGSFRVCIWVLPASIDFCVIVSSFACEYPSFRDNNRLLPTSIYYQAKELQNKVRTLTNIKTPLKTHGNNVTLKAMQCRKCCIYGLCRLSVSVSAGEGDTIKYQSYCSQIRTYSNRLT